MEYTTLKDKIIFLLEKIVERNEFINKKTENVSLLEIDILMQDMRELYNIYSQVRKHVEENVSTELTDKKEVDQQERFSEDTSKKASADEQIEKERSEATIPKQEEVAEKVEEAENTKQEAEEKKEEKIEETSYKEEVKEDIDKDASEESSEVTGDRVEAGRKTGIEKEVVREETQIETPEKEVNKPGVVADKFENENNTAIGDKLVSTENSLHDRISANKEDNSIAAKMQKTSINSLKEAIGMNEKFLFINELFNGNIKAYNEAVEKLNNFGDINEAFEYVNELTASFSWDGNRSASTIEKFANLIQRRYMNK